MKLATALVMLAAVALAVYVATRPRAGSSRAVDAGIRDQLGVAPGGNLEARMTGASGGTAPGAHRSLPSASGLIESGRIGSALSLPSGDALGISAI